MRVFALLALILLFASAKDLSAQYQGENPNPGFIFPIDGGRKVTVNVNPQKGKDLAIGFLTVTSTDSNGALNPAGDQAAVNQLLSQITQLYAQIFNQGAGAPPPAQRQMAPPPQAPPPNQNQAHPSSCSPRRTPRWR